MLSLCAAAASAKEGRWNSTAVDAPLSAFLCAVAASTFLSVDWRLSLAGLDRVYLFGAAAAGLLAAGVWLGARFSADLEHWGQASLAAAGILSLGAILQSLGAGPWESLRDNPLRRYGSFSGDPVSMGSFLAAALPWALHFTAQGGGRRIAAVPAGLLCCTGLFLSGSRAAWLAAAVSCASWLWMRSRKNVEWAGLLLALSLAVLAGRDAGPSDRARLDGWRIAAAEFSERPFLGSGPDTYVYSFRRLKMLETARTHSFAAAHEHAHNDWLQFAATLGLAGLAAYAWLHFSALTRLKSSRGAGLAAAASLTALFLQSKANAPGIPAAWLGALFLGALCVNEGKTSSGFKRRAIACAVLLLPVFSLAVSLRAARAEAASASGLRARAEGRARDAAADFERAIALDPDTPRHRFSLANLLLDAASGAPPEARALMLERAAQAALQGALRHPLDADLHRLLAMVELRRFGAGEDRLGAARAAIDPAWMLDRHNSQAVVLRAYAAYLAGDWDTLNSHAGLLAELWRGGHWRLDSRFDCREIALRKSVEGLDPVEQEVSAINPDSAGRPLSLPAPLWHAAVRLGPPRADLACPNLPE